MLYAELKEEGYRVVTLPPPSVIHAWGEYEKPSWEYCRNRIQRYYERKIERTPREYPARETYEWGVEAVDIALEVLYTLSSKRIFVMGYSQGCIPAQFCLGDAWVAGI